MEVCEKHVVYFLPEVFLKQSQMRKITVITMFNSSGTSEILKNRPVPVHKLSEFTKGWKKKLRVIVQKLTAIWYNYNIFFTLKKYLSARDWKFRGEKSFITDNLTRTAKLCKKQLLFLCSQMINENLSYCSTWNETSETYISEFEKILNMPAR